MKHYNRKYESFSEYLHRFDLFVKNAKMIEMHNSNGNSYSLGINQFADLTREEFKKYYTGVKPRTSNGNNTVYLSTEGVADSIDWVSKGAVTGVKNQGNCGSCWSFSTTGSIEGIHAISTGKLVSLSEQQLIDCSTSYGNQGCNGGLMDDAFQYVEKYGLELESDYGYEASQGTCQYDSSKVVAKITGYTDVPSKNNTQLKAAVSQQPVSVAIEADQFAFQYYSGGVLTGSCGTNLDHGVLAVGYGTDGDTKFWKVKNSWGASWGESGYVRIERVDDTDAAGKCGIAMQASYPSA
jgi:C1A family cysteine protease